MGSAHYRVAAMEPKGEMDPRERAWTEKRRLAIGLGTWPSDMRTRQRPRPCNVSAQLDSPSSSGWKAQ